MYGEKRLTQAVREAATICSCPLQVDLWPLTLKVMSESRMTWANFSLPRPLCSRLRPNVRDRQTSDTHHRLMPPTLGAGHNKLCGRPPQYAPPNAQVDLWPWKWCPSHVWRGLPWLGPMYATDRRQTRIISMPLTYGGGGIIIQV